MLNVIIIFRILIVTLFFIVNLVIVYPADNVLGLCYYEKCHCPEGNERDLETPGSELLIKLQQLLRNQSFNTRDISPNWVDYLPGEK